MIYHMIPARGPQTYFLGNRRALQLVGLSRSSIFQCVQDARNGLPNSLSSDDPDVQTSAAGAFRDNRSARNGRHGYHWSASYWQLGLGLRHLASRSLGIQAIGSWA